MTNCECPCPDDYNEPTVFCERMVKARKPHKCCECGREIKPAETYEYVFGVWDGDALTYKTCNDCLSIRSAFCTCGYVYTRLQADIAEMIRDCAGAVKSDKILSLTPGARKLVLALMDDVLDLPNDKGGGE